MHPVEVNSTPNNPQKRTARFVGTDGALWVTRRRSVASRRWYVDASARPTPSDRGADSPAGSATKAIDNPSSTSPVDSLLPMIPRCSSGRRGDSPVVDVVAQAGGRRC